MIMLRFLFLFINFLILSNGFKNRAVTGFHNDPGRTYSYYAFAEAPMVASNNVVGLAR